jgi:hypothetical protein
VKKAASCALATLLLVVSGGPVAAQEKNEALPRVLSAAAPLYSPLARQARIQGSVTLRVTTDGKRVATFDSQSGPALLVRIAKENVKSWQFEQHKPTSFEITFRYRLTDFLCDSACTCKSDEKESVLLQLPTNVELSATLPMFCESSVTMEEK